jgi:membrane peptidoglycan carboxypeptidase
VTGVWVGFDQPKTIISNGYAGEVAVPMWASFMKSATRGDKPEWLTKPSSVVGLNVCRISGKLPNSGCDHVDVVNRDGNVETRSMIYTEYFVKGTQPTTACPLHERASFMDALAGMFGKDSGPAPVPVDAAGLPATGGARAKEVPAAPPPVPTASAPAPAPAPQPEKAEPARKRGFWSRIFGGRKDEKEKREDQQDQKKQ